LTPRFDSCSDTSAPVRRARGSNASGAFAPVPPAEQARGGGPLAHARAIRSSGRPAWPFVPILPRSCCWAERKAQARALLDDRESLSKGRGAPVNLSSCSPVLSSRTYVDVATVVDFNAFRSHGQEPPDDFAESP
jgi:hypothetical protein